MIRFHPYAADGVSVQRLGCQIGCQRRTAQGLSGPPPAMSPPRVSDSGFALGFRDGRGEVSTGGLGDSYGKRASLETVKRKLRFNGVGSVARITPMSSLYYGAKSEHHLWP